MKSSRWRAILACNKKMVKHKINELTETTNLETHVVKATYSNTASSVNVYVAPKQYGWFD